MLLNILQGNQDFLAYEGAAEHTGEHSLAVGTLVVGNPVEEGTPAEGNLVEGKHPLEDTLVEEEHQLEPAADCSNSSSLNLSLYFSVETKKT